MKKNNHHFRLHKTEDEKRIRADWYRALRAKGFTVKEAAIARDYRDTVIKEILSGIRAINGKVCNG